jgi:hypothetical protein
MRNASWEREERSCKVCTLGILVVIMKMNGSEICETRTILNGANLVLQ